MNMNTQKDLERVLRTTASMVEWPEPRDVALRVVEAIESGPSVRLPVPAPWFRRRALAFAAAIVAVFAATLLLSPGARQAVADLIGLGGIVVRSDPSPGHPSPAATSHLFLGEATTLDEARLQIDRELEVPVALGVPDEVYIDIEVPNTAVSLVYEPDADLPEVNETGIGALLTQFRGRVGEDLIQKVVDFSGADVRRVEVDGNPGYFIRGVHEVFYTTASGEFHQDEIRLSGNSLIWTEGGITHRLETDLSLRGSLEIALSLRGA